MQSAARHRLALKRWLAFKEFLNVFELNLASSKNRDVQSICMMLNCRMRECKESMTAGNMDPADNMRG
jgi:hypothetical protein